MFACYAPPRRSTSSQPQHASVHGPHAVQTSGQDEQRSILDLQRSVYVFPSPPSAPPSPGGSSLFSVPSDVSGVFPGSSTGSHGRDHSLSISTDISSLSREESRRKDNSAGETSTWQLARSSSSGRSLDNAYTDVSVEVWDWAVDHEEEASDDNADWQLETEVERMSRWDTGSNSHRAWPIHLAVHNQSVPRTNSADMTSPPRLTLHYNGRYHRDHQRSRTQSSTSIGSSLPTALSSRASVIQSPQPRIHIPLLSFIASLFSLDLDDPALRLLTNSSSSDTVLFPGQSGLLLESGDMSNQEIELSFDHSSDSEAHAEEPPPQPHGLLRLFVLTNDSRISIRAVRDGLRVVCNPSIVAPASFSVPSLSSVFGLYNVLGDVLSKGGKAWRELRFRETGQNPTL